MSPLTGIRVLDLSLQLPGPFCTMMMADHCADVVEVDEPAPRVRDPFAGEEWGQSPAGRYLNRGKRSLTLNLKTEEGKNIFRALAEHADVVVEGFRPGAPRASGSTTRRSLRDSGTGTSRSPTSAKRGSSGGGDEEGGNQFREAGIG